MLSCLAYITAVAPFATASVAPVAAKLDQAVALESLRRARREAAHRKRRVIYNNDGNEPVYYCSKATPEELLRIRTTGLEGSHVDSIFYCTWSSGFGLFTHNTQVGEVLTGTDGILAKNQTAGFIAQGTDPLQILVNFGKRNGIEVFWSMRMNDVHDGEYPEIFPRWKTEHPECLFGTKESKPKGIRDGRMWAGVDFGRSEVRERAYRFIEEVCENYDVDGIELDFCRHYTFFRCHAAGYPCGKEELDQMTGLVRRVRLMTEAVGLRRGRPILVGVRVPDSVGYCEATGLDITRWLDEGLVDLMAVSDYFQLSPWQESVALGHRYGVPVYAGLSESRIRGDAGKQRNRLEVYRARALNAWNAGVDGIYTFNLFWKPDHAVWRELGDPEVLRRMDKMYYVAYRGPSYAGIYLKDGERFVHIPTLCPERPVTVKAGQPQATTLTVGDDLAAAQAAGLKPDLRLCLQVDKLTAMEELVVKLNGQVLAEGMLAEDWIEYRPAPDLVKLGDNVVEMSVAPDSGDAPVIQDLQLRVSFGKSP